jgi:TadE-like protein
LIALLASRSGQTKGQTMLEFALVAPLAFILLFGLVDVARAVFYYNTISNAAREGAREAVLSYNQFGNSQPNPAPPGPTDVIGVDPAVSRAGAGVLQFDFLNGTGTSGQSPACGPANNEPSPNRGCVWVFEVGTGGTCTSPTTANPANAPNTGPNPTGVSPDQYSDRCDFSSLKAGGHHDVVVEIEFRFAPYTPIVSNLMGAGIDLWAKSEMRTEY